ncbi:MAG TPA: circularly permuted type 2 ATP-grasp protein, partial [Acidimicrobiales bacterium]|nr:circularly permuted type 2 ATP-grasp protein [Acidimicrobiales bacterium]
MDDLFSGYSPGAAWDEILEDPGRPRAVARGLYDTLHALTPSELDERCAERDRSFRDRGITFSLSGEERPFPLDPIPRPVSAAEWVTVEAGVRQRVRALEALLSDVYGAGEALADGVLPRRVVTTAEHFERAAFGVVPPNGVRIQVAGIDLVRDAAGRFCVLEDNVRIPSGVSYVLENRRTMTRIFPELFTSQRILPVEEYPARLLAALRAASPSRSGSDPTVVVLTPGVHNSAYFEHSFLARQMGLELVEGRDLVCRANCLYMHTTSGDERVDVVYRRVDDAWLDPVQFEPTSLLGCPGLLNAVRAGNVSIANAVGNGVADDKLVYTYVPDLITYYLG